MTKKIAITGATGFIGAGLAHAFAARDWTVLALTRRPRDYSRTDRLVYAPFDLARAHEVDLADVDVLIHCALAPYTTANPSSSVNVGGSRRLFESARRQRVKRIVFVSSTASRAATPSEYGADKYAVEQMLDPARDLIIRPGLVVGDGGLLRSMYRTIKKYRCAPLFFGGKKPVYSVGLDDFIDATVTLIERNAHGALTLCAPPIPMRSLYEQLARKANVPLCLVPLPYTPVLRVVEAFERMGVRLPLSSGSMKGVAATEELALPQYAGTGILIRPFSSVIQDLVFSDT